MSELGLDMLNPLNWIPQTLPDTLGCLGMFVVACIFGCIMCIPFTFIKHNYCIKCNHEIYNENYCPICGTPTDSVNTYNYWNKPKEN